MTDQDKDAARIVREADQDHAAARADAAERLRQQMTIADAAMKALLLVNGGAMIALFTFVGNLLARSATAPLFDAGALWWAFACFVAGLVLALLTHLAAFLSQDRYYVMAMHEAWRQQRIAATGVREPTSAVEMRFYRQGLTAYVAALAMAALSIAAFVIGCGCALAGVLAP